MSDAADRVPVAEPFELTLAGRPDAASTYACGFHAIVVEAITAVVTEQARAMGQPLAPRPFVTAVTEAAATGLERIAAFLRAVDRESTHLAGAPLEQWTARIHALEARHLLNAAPAAPAGCVAEGEERDGCVRRGYCWRPTPCT